MPEGPSPASLPVQTVLDLGSLPRLLLCTALSLIHLKAWVAFLLSVLREQSRGGGWEDSELRRLVSLSASATC